jgi:hypothetical protein
MGVQSASGTLELQDASQFTAAAISGSYAFNLSGANASSKPGSLAEAGSFTSNGALLISSGVEDVNDSGSPSTGVAVSGIYSAPLAATGKGTLTLNGTPFVYYIVDGTHLKVVGTSAAAQLVGDVYKQPAGPFNNASIRGGFAFAMLGSTSAGALGEGGVITLDGTGNVTTAIIDVNNGHSPPTSNPGSGSYNIATADVTTGRTTVTVNAGGLMLLYAAYPQINGALSVVEIDTSNVVAGRALGQNGAPFSGGSLIGNFAMNLTGTDFVVNPGEEDLVAAVLPNGGSAITGSADISDNGVLTHSAALTGSYSVSPSGRGSASLTAAPAFNNSTFNLYIADSSDALFLESDGTRVLVGMAQKQF